MKMLFKRIWRFFFGPRDKLGYMKDSWQPNGYELRNYNRALREIRG